MFLVATLFLAGLCYGSQEGTENTIALTLILTDWAQTRAMARQPAYDWEPLENSPGYYTWREQWRENNPLLGRHPSEGKVNTYFALSVLTYLVVQDALPEKYASLYRKGIILLEVTCVSQNLSIGVRF